MKIPQKSKILYTSPRGIGDVMFSLPLLHSLRKAYPEATIYLPIPRDKVDALGLVGFVQRTPRFMPKPSEDTLARERWAASANGDTAEKYRLEKLIFDKYLAGESYDLALVPKNFRIDSISCPEQINDEDLAKSCNAGFHMVDRFLGFARHLGIEEVLSFELGFNLNDEIKLNSGWNISTQEPYIVLNLGASLDKKTWPVEGYSDTAKWCTKNGLRVILVGDKECFDSSLDIQKDNKGIFNSVLRDGYSLNLENYGRLAAQSTAVVCVDSGLLHLADATGTKVIGLYGPTSPERFGPYNNRGNVVSRHSLDQNVKNISSSEVTKKLEDVL